MISFTIPGRPVPKARPRMAVHGREAYIYTPDKTKNYEELVKWVSRLNVKRPLRCPVEIEANLYFKGKQTPDLDNCLKSLLDGMNKAVYDDDSQVKRIIAEMHQVPHKKMERAEVKIRGIETCQKLD